MFSGDESPFEGGEYSCFPRYQHLLSVVVSLTLRYCHVGHVRGIPMITRIIQNNDLPVLVRTA